MGKGCAALLQARSGVSRAGEGGADKLGGIQRLASRRSERQQEGFMEEA